MCVCVCVRAHECVCDLCILQDSLVVVATGVGKEYDIVNGLYEFQLNYTFYDETLE